MQKPGRKGEGGTRRVVYLDHTAKPSGAELALLRLVSCRPGGESHVILGEDGPLAERLRSVGVSIEVLALPATVSGIRKEAVGAVSPSALWATALHIIRLAVRLRRLHPDLVHTNSLKSAFYGGVAARLAGLPVVWHIRDRIADDYLPAIAVRVVHMASVAIPDAVIVDSDAVRRTLPRGVRVFQVPSSIPDLGIDRTERPAARPLRVVVVGRLTPWKGQDLFLQAFDRAFGAGEEQAVLVGGALFGEEAFAEQLRTLIEGRLAGRVRMTGHLDDITAELADADIVVHAARIPEPFGLVVLEAMSAGVAVLAPDQGGPAEVITDGVDGLLYRAGSMQDLACKLVTLGGDPVLRDRLAATGRQRAATYRPEVLAPLVEDVYEAVLRHRPNLVRRTCVCLRSRRAGPCTSDPDPAHNGSIDSSR